MILKRSLANTINAPNVKYKNTNKDMLGNCFQRCFKLLNSRYPKIAKTTLTTIILKTYQIESIQYGMFSNVLEKSNGIISGFAPLADTALKTTILASTNVAINQSQHHFFIIIFPLLCFHKIITKTTFR